MVQGVELKDAALPGVFANVGTEEYPISLVVTAMCADAILCHVETMTEGQVADHPKVMEFLREELTNGDYTRVRFGCAWLEVS